MNDLEEFIKRHMTARLKRFYRSAGNRNTVGFLRGYFANGEETNNGKRIVWSSKGIYTGKWHTWQEADQIVRNIMEERDREIDALASMECEQLSIFGN